MSINLRTTPVVTITGTADITLDRMVTAADIRFSNAVKSAATRENVVFSRKEGKTIMVSGVLKYSPNRAKIQYSEATATAGEIMTANVEFVLSPLATAAEIAAFRLRVLDNLFLASSLSFIQSGSLPGV